VKGIPLFISVLVHLFGGAFLGWEFIQPAEFMSAAPAPSLAVSLIDASATPSPVMPEPPPELPKVAEVPVVRKETPRKIVKQPQQPQIAAVSTTKTVPSDSQGTTPDSVLVRAHPDYLRNPPPVYPAECRRRREEGLVLLSVVIAQDGTPADVQIKESSKYERLDASALKAVSKWRFKPATLAGLTVASRVDVPVRFSLKDRP
jgi:protein TonB